MKNKEDTALSRRGFLQRAALSVGALGLTPVWVSACGPLASVVRNSGSLLDVSDPWNQVPAILARIRPPVFPPREFNILSYGAVADGNTDTSDAFRRAIEACGRAGGGRVRVPAGRFATGPIHLRSNVELHVEKNATIAFSTEPAKYLPLVLSRFEGVEVMNYSPLIYALDAENVAVTGAGTLDGQANSTNWWPWKGNAAFGWKKGAPRQAEARDRLFGMAEKGVPVGERLFGTGNYLRPSFIQPYRCRNVLIQGVTILNSPMWEIHPVLCSNVTVLGVSITTHGPNNDGCNPESCRDVLIEKCYFNTGDDCIAIKSGRNADGRRLNVPSENIIVRGCEMRDGHGGVTIGSEISGGVRNVFAEDCVMDSPNLDRALRFKNNASRGGVLENVYMRNIRVGELADAVLQIDFLYEEGANGNFNPVVRNVELRNVTSSRSNYGIYIRGIPKGTISDIRILDCRFENVAKDNVAELVSRLVIRNTTVNGVSVDT